MMRVFLFVSTVMLFANFTTANRKRHHLEKNKGGENEVFGKPHITLRFPSNILLIQSQSTGKTTGSRQRRLQNGVEPVLENCRSSNFTKPYSQLKKRVKCELRDAVVELIAPHGTTISPNTVIVKRCGGMCNGYKRCLSKKTRNRKFYVRTIERLQTYCNSVMVPEDVECRCGCEFSSVDCLPMQQYNVNTCSCSCKNTKDYEDCSNRSHFIWDETTCSCICAHRKTCTTGTVWLPEECRCVKLQKDFLAQMY